MSVYPNAIIIDQSLLPKKSAGGIAAGLFQTAHVAVKTMAHKQVFKEFIGYSGKVAIKRRLFWPDLTIGKAIKTFLCISGMNYKIRDGNGAPNMVRIRLDMQKLLLRSFVASGVNINSICQGKSLAYDIKEKNLGMLKKAKADGPAALYEELYKICEMLVFNGGSRTDRKSMPRLGVSVDEGRQIYEAMRAMATDEKPFLQTLRKIGERFAVEAGRLKNGIFFY